MGGKRATYGFEPMQILVQASLLLGCVALGKNTSVNGVRLYLRGLLREKIYGQEPGTDWNGCQVYLPSAQTCRNSQSLLLIGTSRTG